MFKFNRFKKSKYNNKKVVTPDGLKFDSQKEYQRYLTLKILEDKGYIFCLQMQVPYILIPSSDKFRMIKYVADFVYTDDKGFEIVEDCKGFKTKEYELKKKLMYHFHKIIIKET